MVVCQSFGGWLVGDVADKRGMTARVGQLSCRTWTAKAGTLVIALTVLTPAAPVQADQIFGARMDPGSSMPGAFRPAGTWIGCYSINGNQCWDGKRWQELYPAGPRHYALARTPQVAYRVITEPDRAC
jgi:hypothetical protein